MSRFALITLAALAAAAPALAQAPQAAPAAQSLGGSALPGVCLLSQQAVLANSKVGVAASARLKQLMDQAQSEIGSERAPIDADIKALRDQEAKLKPQEVQQKGQALQGRLQVLQQKADLRSREMEVTRQKALTRVAQEAQPVIAQVYKTHNCSLLFDRASVLGGNMSGDLTTEVIKGLDAKISTITFDRETTAPAPKK